MKKADIIVKLTELGIEHDPEAKVAELEALLPEDAKVKGEEHFKGVVVGDPEAVRPVVLPLIVKPEKGEWDNEEQVKFAKTLNAFAYEQPIKWKERKDKLIAQLIEIGTNPDLYYVLSGEKRGEKDKVQFRNRLHDLG